MISAIHPDLIIQAASGPIVFAHGVGYDILLSARALSSLCEGKIVYTKQMWSESSGPCLYGFPDEEERNAFCLFTSVPGVGPSTGMLIVNSMTPEEAYMNIDAENVEAFTAIKGIGPKTAKQIIISLKKEIGLYDKELAKKHSSIISAVTRLGYKKTDAMVALSKIAGISGMSEEDGIRALLRELQSDKKQ